MLKTTSGRLVATAVLGAAALGFALALSRDAAAHCDTMDGPVVAAAKTAIEKGDPTPVLKWVGKAQEDEIKAAFTKTLAARSASAEARELADTWFFETLVRVHRAGEGEPFTGLKPAGTALDPVVKEADAALESGSVDDLAKDLAAAVTDGVKSRFARVLDAKKRADKSVDAGREYVAAYVEYVHCVERLHAAATGPAHHHGEAHEGHEEK